MELLFLALVAGVAGYFLARSKYRKNIDSTANSVVTGTKSAGNRFSNWFSGLFKRTAAETPPKAPAEQPKTEPPSDTPPQS
jgi:hypothetical protein